MVEAARVCGGWEGNLSGRALRHSSCGVRSTFHTNKIWSAGACLCHFKCEDPITSPQLANPAGLNVVHDDGKMPGNYEIISSSKGSPVCGVDVASMSLHPCLSSTVAAAGVAAEHLKCGPSESMCAVTAKHAGMSFLLNFLLHALDFESMKKNTKYLI